MPSSLDSPRAASICFRGSAVTGKTSLPRAFARAIGATSSLVEVQSGWRDRNDLLGYYNAFEKRFYESEFLQALYRAQQPSHLALPYLIILDEMNLSHPEHYFADFLSALEQRQTEQRISLLTARVDGAPQLLEESRWLRIPDNVWFIGTANHDEPRRTSQTRPMTGPTLCNFHDIPKHSRLTPSESPRSRYGRCARERLPERPAETIRTLVVGPRASWRHLWRRDARKVGNWLGESARAPNAMLHSGGYFGWGQPRRSR